MEVSVLPQGIKLANNIETQENSMQSTKTYKIDFDKGKVAGLCDELEALKQAIYLILNTERYEYLIYSWDYGVELKDVIAQDKAIAESEIKRRIKEALIQDDRITNVDNFIFKYEKDSVAIEFTVFTVYGEFQQERRLIK